MKRSHWTAVVSFSLVVTLLVSPPTGVAWLPSTGMAWGQESPGDVSSSGSADGSSSPVVGQGDSAADSTQPDAEDILRRFKEKAPAEVREAGLSALDKFLATSEEFQRSVIEMRKQHTLYANGYVDEKKPYLDLRDRSRELMNQAHTEALALLNYFPHPDAVRFILTVLEYRVKRDIYDAQTLEGAAKLLDLGVRLLYVAQAAARSGMVVGDFDLSERIYKSLEDDELTERDQRLIAQREEIMAQFEAEQEMLKNDPDDLPQAIIQTTRGEMVVDLFIDQAPSTVSNFIQLAESGFYDGLDFFQVVEGLVALTGDPLGDGTTQPDRFIADEHDRDGARKSLRGSLVMAKLPKEGNQSFIPNSAGTQIAILLMPYPKVCREQTVFGRVVDGLDVLGALRHIDPNKAKEKNAIMVPPDRILEIEIVNRPESLPPVNYVDVPG